MAETISCYQLSKFYKKNSLIYLKNVLLDFFNYSDESGTMVYMLIRLIKKGLILLTLLFSLVAYSQTAVNGGGSWHDAGNWSAGVPDVNDDVEWSKKNLTLTISSANGTAKSISITTFGNTLNVTNARTLTIEGDFTASKEFTLNITGNSTVIINGTLSVAKDFVTNVEAGSALIVTNVVAAKDATLTIAGDMTVAEDFIADKDVVMTISGTLDVGDEFKTGTNPSITIDGGTLSARSVDTSDSDIIVINGGTVESDDCSGVSNGETVCNSSLPVTLSSFNAAPKNQSFKISWVTLTEINFDYFEIQRAGKDEIFTTLDIIPGSGTSKEKVQYTWEDKKPMTGINYYQLVSNDYDGYREVFKPIMVLFEPENFNIKVYPNPVSSGTEIHIDNAENTTLSLYAVSGTKILHSVPYIDFFQLPSDIKPGIYLLDINVNGVTKQEKIIVK